MSTWQILLFGSVPTFVFLYGLTNEWVLVRFGWRGFLAAKLALYGVCASAYYLFI